MEKELARLKKARKQVYRDIKEFVEERDKQPWRTWDHCLIVNDTRKKSKKEMDAEIEEYDIEINLLLSQIEILEKGVNSLDADYPIFFMMDKDMETFTTAQLGHDWWLRLDSIKQNRKKQLERQAEYDPKPEEIKKTMNPYPEDTI